MMLLNMIFNAFSFFIILYVLYILFRRKWLQIVASIMIVSSQLIVLLQFILFNLITFQNILIVVEIMGAPLLAVFAFFYYIGDLRLSKEKRRKLKSFKDDIKTKRQFFYYSIISIISSIAVFIYAYFNSTMITMYLLFGVSSIMLISGIILLLHEQSIVSETVILLIGKEKNRIYHYEIPKQKLIVKTSDFFNNDLYIVDKIGEVEIKLENKKSERHYLYWVATNDQINMKDQNVDILKNLSYQELLEQFEKYHYRSMVIQISKMGKIEIIKNKILK